MEIVKFFHFFGLMLGAGAGLGGMAAAIAHKRAGGGPPSDTIKAIKPIFGIFGLSGISLLWITGLIMTFNVASGVLGALFYLKLLIAAAMLAISVFLMVMAKRAAKAGVPPPSYLDALGRFSGLLAIVAVALAVTVFISSVNKSTPPASTLPFSGEMATVSVFPSKRFTPLYCAVRASLKVSFNA